MLAIRGVLGPVSGHRLSRQFLFRNWCPPPGLKPESVLSVDFGLKWSTPRFRAEAFGFHSRFEDKITAVPTGEFTPEGRQIVRSENLNSVKFWGAEAAGRFRVTDEWNLFASFTYTWAREKLHNGEAAPADRIPPANGRIGWLYAARGPWWAEGFVRFATEQDRLSERDRRDPRINPNGTPGWVTANLRIGWDVNEHLSTQIAIENIFDTAYREHGSGIDAPGVNALVRVELRY